MHGIPLTSANSLMNRADPDSELLGDLFHGQARVVGVCETPIVIGGVSCLWKTEPGSNPPPLDGVSHVLGLGPDFEMTDLNAPRPVVAAMADNHPRGHWPMYSFPCDPRGSVSSPDSSEKIRPVSETAARLVHGLELIG